MNTISVVYTIKYQLNFATEYKWLDDNRCFNSKSGRFIKQVYCSGSIGYCIRGKFYSLKYLRKNLENIKKEKLPF